ncbi:MAG: response regulator [Planctomycetota bacterium]
MSVDTTLAVRVLLVDDEPHITHLVRRRLQGLGIGVRVTRDGQEGFAAAVSEPPELIVSDLQMPKIDGLTLAEQLRADERTADVPILMISGRGFLLSNERVAKTNIIEVFEKPFSIETVLDRILSLLGERSDRADAA